MVARSASRKTRPPAVAGSFYPGAPLALGRTVGELLAAAPPPGDLRVRGIIAPHAGYVYSGSVAARAFAALLPATGRFRRAVVIGPSHYVAFSGIAAPSHAAFDTPLGAMPVDQDAVQALVQGGLVVIDDVPHAPDHALEVELPFLLQVFGPLPIVPLLCGHVPPRAVAEALAVLWTDDTLLVVSSDLSHFERYEQAQAHDLRTAEAIERGDEVAIGPRDACGHLAIRGALIAAGEAPRRLELLNSGDTAGDSSRVVGYGAWAWAEAR